jgi:hypothetical protein
MPLDLDCPKCRHVFPVTEARHPVGVQCPGCAAELTAEFRRLPVPTPGQPHYELLVSVGRPPGSAPPPPAGKPRKADDGEKRKGGSMAVVVLAGLGALVVTLGGLGAVGYVLFTNMDPPPDTTSNRPGGGGPSRPPGGNRPGNNEPPPPKKKAAPKPGEFVSAEWGFIAKFPSEPKTQRPQAAGGALTTFSVEAKDRVLMVVAADAPVGDDESAAQTQARLQSGQDRAIAGFGGTLKSSSEVTLAGHPGREFTAAITKPVVGQVRGRVYLVGKRLYQVMAVGPAAYVNSADARALFDSFRLAE